MPWHRNGLGVYFLENHPYSYHRKKKQKNIQEQETLLSIFIKLNGMLVNCHFTSSNLLLFYCTNGPSLLSPYGTDYPKIRAR